MITHLKILQPSILSPEHLVKSRILAAVPILALTAMSEVCAGSSLYSLLALRSQTIAYPHGHCQTFRLLSRGHRSLDILQAHLVTNSPCRRSRARQRRRSHVQAPVLSLSFGRTIRHIESFQLTVSIDCETLQSSNSPCEAPTRTRDRLSRITPTHGT